MFPRYHALTGGILFVLLFTSAFAAPAATQAPAVTQSPRTDDIPDEVETATEAPLEAPAVEMAAPAHATGSAARLDVRFQEAVSS
jgi:hypothetical protein